MCNDHSRYCSTTGNFSAVSRKILDRLPDRDDRMSYVYVVRFALCVFVTSCARYDRHTFHILVSGGITYLCMADDAFPRKVAFMCLDSIMQRFTQATRPASLSTRSSLINPCHRHILPRVKPPLICLSTTPFRPSCSSRCRVPPPPQRHRRDALRCILTLPRAPADGTFQQEHRRARQDQQSQRRSR
jgi:hypothetical protein